MLSDQQQKIGVYQIEVVSAESRSSHWMLISGCYLVSLVLILITVYLLVVMHVLQIERIGAYGVSIFTHMAFAPPLSLFS